MQFVLALSCYVRENSNLAKIRDLLLPKLLNGGIQNE